MRKSKLLLKNITQIILFEFVFKLLTLFIAVPLFMNLFNLIMKVTGYEYLTAENIVYFLINPITIVLIILLLFVMCFYSLFDIGTLIILLDSSFQNKKVHLIDSIKVSFKKSLNVFKIKNVGYIFYVLILVPFVNLGVGSSVISVICIPEFIMDSILHNYLFLTLYSLLTIILLIINLKWIYSLHYYFLEDKNFIDSIKCSNKLSKKNNIKDFIVLFLMQSFIYLVFIVGVVLFILLLSLFAYLFENIAILESVFLSIILIFIILSICVLYIVNTAVSYFAISNLFYKHKEEKNEKVVHLNIKEKSKKTNFIPFYIICIIAVICMSFFMYGVIKGDYNYNIEYVKKMEISAHRGASVDYPENTMSAFVAAKKLDADWVELDVQQTKDKVIIVSHDTNFSRTAGVDKNIWELTYDQVEKFDVGSFKDEKFKGEKVPLLEDVIIWAKLNNMKLNIELKPTGHEKDFEKQVVDLINEYDFEEDCVITSQVYEVLENIKKVDTEVPTVYVMSIAIGDITVLDKADNFSLESSNINYDVVSNIHAQGKEVYGWTVDSEDTINEMINYNVDNIITNDIALAKKIVKERKNSDVLNETIRIIYQLFY